MTKCPNCGIQIWRKPMTVYQDCIDAIEKLAKDESTPGYGRVASTPQEAYQRALATLRRFTAIASTADGDDEVIPDKV